MLNIFTYTDTFEDQSRCHSFEEEEKEVALPSDSLMMMGFARGFPFFSQNPSTSSYPGPRKHRYLFINNDVPPGRCPVTWQNWKGFPFDDKCEMLQDEVWHVLACERHSSVRMQSQRIAVIGAVSSVQMNGTQQGCLSVFVRLYLNYVQHRNICTSIFKKKVIRNLEIKKQRNLFIHFWQPKMLTIDNPPFYCYSLRW